MKTTRIEAKEAREDIRAGMNYIALMNKYRLSAKGFQSLSRVLLRQPFFIRRLTTGGRFFGNTCLETE